MFIYTLMSFIGILQVIPIKGEDIYDCTGDISGTCRDPVTCTNDYFAKCPIPGSNCCPEPVPDQRNLLDEQINEEWHKNDNGMESAPECRRLKPCRIRPKCVKLGGYCVRRKKSCAGRVLKKQCKGRKCFCCIPDPTTSTTTTTIETTTTTRVPSICPLTGLPGVACTAPTSCAGYGTNLNGVYDICPSRDCPPVKVRCMGDGWTVILYRNTSYFGSCNFAQDWSVYETGFCSASGEYWLGNAILHLLTGDSPYQMQVYGVTSSGASRTMAYNTFSVADESDEYRLTVQDFDSAASNTIDQFENPSNTNIILNGMQFTAKDRDNDFRGNLNCVLYCEDGGWWFNSCTGLLLTRTTDLRWYYWDPFTYGPVVLQGAHMKIKPNA